jgi:hypothetical protein
MNVSAVSPGTLPPYRAAGASSSGAGVAARFRRWREAGVPRNLIAAVVEWLSFTGTKRITRGRNAKGMKIEQAQIAVQQLRG